MAPACPFRHRTEKCAACGRERGMGLFQKNELIELLERLTKWLLAIRAAYASGRNDEALDEIRKARALLAGALGSSIERVDGSTVLALLGPERARVYAELARLEAEVR